MPPEISGKGMDEAMMRSLADLPADVIQASLQAAAVGMLQVAMSALTVPTRLKDDSPCGLSHVFFQAILQQQSALRSSLQQQLVRGTSSHSKFQVQRVLTALAYE